MSLSTTFSHVIFGLPLPLLPSTVISILFFTQSFPPPFLNTCPIHLSLLHLITSLIFSMLILSLFSSLSVTLHTSISPFSFQLSQVLLPAQHSLPMFHIHISLNFEHMPHTLSLSTSMPQFLLVILSYKITLYHKIIILKYFKKLLQN